MTFSTSGEYRAHSAALSVVPILIVACTIIAAMSLLAKSSFEQNEKMTTLLEQRRIDLALDSESRRFADTVQREVALLTETTAGKGIDLDRVHAYIANEHKIDFLAVYDKSGKLISVRATRNEILERRLKAADELIAERHAQKTAFTLRRIGMSTTLVDPKAIVTMAAISLGDRFDLVVTRRVEDTVLAEIGATLLLNNLRFRDSALSSPDAPEDSTAHLAWNRVSEGTFTLESLASIGFTGIAIIGIYGLLVFLHIRRVTRELEHSEARAQHMAGHDSLSGLPNRTLFSKALNQELSRIAREGGGLSVMYLDLDKFKEVNDLYGHAAGDKLIIQVAERLGQLVRGADTVARFGGDEFAIIQTNMRTIADAEVLARRVMDELRRPFYIDEIVVTIGCSIGITVAPDNGDEALQLMRNSDIALYRAKNEGRNRYSFFEQEMNETLRLKKIVEDELRTAIEKKHLVLYYQPVVTADGGRIVSMEALVRWNHPERGIIPPIQFIAIAEERGLISALGEWVLRQACLDGKRFPGISVAVNVSPVQFRQKDFVANVARILDETGFDPTRLELELTEGVVVDDADVAEAAIIELRAMGVRFALDDFGVGYSSLIYLRRFAFDRIKIDKSFLESMEATGESAILVHSIVHLGRALGLEVTAEGVETEEQQRFLQAVGCHHLQGYFFARPCNVEDVAKLLSRTNGQLTSAAA